MGERWKVIENVKRLIMYIKMTLKKTLGLKEMIELGLSTGKYLAVGIFTATSTKVDLQATKGNYCLAMLNKEEKFLNFIVVLLHLTYRFESKVSGKKVYLHNIKSKLQVVCAHGFLRLVERSQFTQAHVKIISFFFRPWHPSAFNLFICNFLANYWSDWLSFCITSMTCARSIILQNFGSRNNLSVG